MRVARPTTTFERKKPRFKQQARVLVLCEDTKSSRDYLTDAALYFRANAEVDIVHCGKNDPLGIVREAIARQRLFDSVYCAIDRDQDTRFDEAMVLASKQAKITVIASYPCYEYWLLLHFRKTRKSYFSVGKNSAGDLLVKDLCKEEGMDNYDKGTSKTLFNDLLVKLPNARLRATQVLTEAINDGGINPSTRLHELIELFEQLGTLQPVA